jgi:hypothetical protein
MVNFCESVKKKAQRKQRKKRKKIEKGQTPLHLLFL